MLLFLFCLIFLPVCINADTIYLVDGKTVTGELCLLTKYNVGIKVNNIVYIFNYFNIDYYMADSFNEKKIRIKYKGISKKVILLKLTENLLYYRDSQDNSFKIVALKDLSVLNYSMIFQNRNYRVIYYNRIKRENDINDDLDNIIEMIYHHDKSIINAKDMDDEKFKVLIKSINIDINSDDFYEKLWDKINNLLDQEVSAKFWKLLEDYYNREKYILLLINEMHNDMNLRRNEILLNNLKKEINIIRNEFYRRIRKIIITYGLAVK